MSTTFTIGGVAFSGLDDSTLRQAISIKQDSRNFTIRRFHPPGTSGNIIIRDRGPSGGNIEVSMRYVGTPSQTETAFDADKAAWRNTAVTIIDDNGESLPTCNLMPGMMRRTTDPKGIGDGKVFFDASATFMNDGV